MSNHKLKLLNRKFGKLTVIKEIQERDECCHVYWECKCDCGKLIILRGSKLIKKINKSCGCDSEKEFHNMSNTKLYSVWHGMKVRCTLPSCQAYKDYGGRGITICNRWLNSFINFYNDMNETYVEGLFIDRIDNNGNYEPSNCRWATLSQQNRNKRDNRYLTFKNKTQTIADWSDETGLKHSTITRRLKRNWTIERALTTPRMKNYPLTLK